ncbi:MFS general substrate transporter [Suillus spraguei]|nr:MFS general substrate transporter [Suillus spraguei]
MIESGKLYGHISTWLSRWKLLNLPSSGMSYRPLLAEVDDISSGSSDDNPTFTLDYIDRLAVEKRLLRKLDLRVAFLVLILIVNNMDCTNAAVARLHGYEEDLGMVGNDFNTLMSIFYVGYFLTQAPSNMFLDRMVRPSLYLSSCMVIWGCLTVLMGAVQTYYASLMLRFLVGFVEATFFPGAVFVLSRWYKPNELGLRTALLSCGGSISNAFGALFASGIVGSLDGTLGFTAWRWLFFVEGALTIVVALSAMGILPDFPSSPNIWLLPDEQILAKQRMEEVTSKNEHKSKPREYYSGLAEALMDWKVWWVGVALHLMFASMSFGMFFPTLSATMGYNETTSLLLCAPPWILGTATSFVVARHSDATGDRFWHIAGPLLVGIAGFILAISTMNTTVRYISLFLMTQGPVAYVIALTWIMNTFSQAHSKRAAAIALINSIGTAGAIGSSYFWPFSWGPSYVKSYMICILTSIMSIAMFWVLRMHLSRCNEAAEAEEKSLGLPKGLRHLL